MNLVRERDSRDMKNLKIHGEATEVTQMEAMMKRLLYEQKEEINSSIKSMHHEMSSRLGSLEALATSNETAIAQERIDREQSIEQERIEREKQLAEIREEIRELKSKLVNASPTTTVRSTRVSTQGDSREPICVIGGFYPSDRDAVKGMLNTLMCGIDGFKKILPMGEVPKVAFIEFETVDTMYDFVNSFKSRNAEGKLWTAPKRSNDKEDMSQIILNKIKRAICESTSCPGKAIMFDRSSKPRMAYKMHNGKLVEIAKVDANTHEITWNSDVEMTIRERTDTLISEFKAKSK
eukprot:4814367-Karenia_brevis.AAC.1